MRTVQHFIGGARRPGEGRLSIYDPATGEVQALAPVADVALIDEAVRVARTAQAAWAATSLSKRTGVLFSFRQLLVEHSEELAALVTSEHGKTLADARGEVARGLENVEYACALVELLKGEFSDEVASGVDVHSVREPVGVVVAVTPFNFPVMVPLWMSANAIAAGNAVVAKPSERDPSASLLLAELWQRAGLPDGVLNVLHGDRTVVEALVTHVGVDAVSFVGSTPVARHVFDLANAAGKRVQALGGAKNHMVVLADADLDVAADAAINAGFGSAGERCMAVSVVVAIDAVADELIDRVAKRLDGLRVGPGSDPTSDFGPLITPEHLARVRDYVTGAEAEGARVVRDGTTFTLERGFYVGPSLLDGVRPGTRAYDEEIFGPVLGVVRVATLHEAIELVNANPYGNGVAIFTRDGFAARTFARRVRVGMIGVNVAIPVPISAYSFGGWKNSLFGHAHIYGPEGVAFYTRAKVITTRWPQPEESRLDLGFPTTR